MTNPAELSLVEKNSLNFLIAHHIGSRENAYFAGDFSLYRHIDRPNLYGMIDAVYILYTLGKLTEKTNSSSRAKWAENILACQDELGWFSRLNLRGHPREHATAYAIGALRLLEVEPDEHYVDRVKPIVPLLPILTNYRYFLRWISALDFRWSPESILRKNLGWHYIWRGSHVGGGVAAIIGMLYPILEHWWPGQVDVEQWFGWYFEWLDAHANPQTGYWQRALWNLVYRKPTLVDMGGAVHFFWVYEALKRPFPYPEAVIRSTLSLQRPDGLYKDRPFCIDFDGNFCLVRAYLQLPLERQILYKRQVYQAVEKSFEAIVRFLTTQPLEAVYADSHGLPGALAALMECTKLPDFKYAELIEDWQHPLDRAWWL